MELIEKEETATLEPEELADSVLCAPPAAEEETFSPESPSPAAFGMGVLLLTGLAAASLYGLTAGLVSVGEALPLVAAAVVLVLALCFLELACRFTRKSCASRDAKAAIFLDALATRRDIEVPDGEVGLGNDFLCAKEDLEASIQSELKANEDALRKEARHDLVRARSQCEQLVEKHVETVYRKKREKETELKGIRQETAADKETWVETQERLEAEISRLEEANLSLAELADRLEGEISATSDENSRLSSEHERLLTEVASLRGDRPRFFKALIAQIRGPLQLTAQLASQLSQKVGKKSADSKNAAWLQEQADGILGRAEQLQYLLARLEDLCRLESASLKLVYSKVDINRFGKKLISELRQRAKKKGVELSSSIPKDLPLMTTDERLCGKILKELLINALRFTDRGGRVSFRVTVQPPNEQGLVPVEFEVEDTGPGILPEDRERVFKAFEQAHPHPTFSLVNCEDYSCGLGLPLTRGFVYLLGGQITLVPKEDDGASSAFESP